MPVLPNSEQTPTIQNNHSGPKTNSTTTLNTEKIQPEKRRLQEETKKQNQMKIIHQSRPF
jgi:hypothetical protein